MKRTNKRVTAVLLAVVTTIPCAFSVNNHSSAKAYGEEYSVIVDTSKRSFRWPVPDCTGISSCFEDGRNHGAIDITAPMGTPIYAAASGRVSLVRTGCSHNYPEPCNCNGGGGNYVVLEHSIAGTTYWTCYMHCTDIYVSEGDWVDSGKQIATIGSTGSSYGFHCDYSIRTGSSWTDRRLDPGYYTQLPSVLRYTGTSPECCLPYLQDIATSPGIILENQVLEPGKPVVSVSATDSDHPVEVSYNACANTTHYDIRFYNQDDTLVWAVGQCEDGAAFGNLVTYTGTSYSHTFEPGSYSVKVASVNGNDATYTFSDAVPFTVSAPPKKLTIYYNVNGGTLAKSSEYQADTDAESKGLILDKSSGNAYTSVWENGSGNSEYGLTDADTFQLSRKGFRFRGWSLVKSGGTIYKEDDLSLTANDICPDIVNGSTSVTLYARWETVTGDINKDGQIDRKDLDLLQSWLLAIPDTNLPNATAADMNGDSKLTAVDLTLLKREIMTDMGLNLALNKSSIMLSTVGSSTTYQLISSYPHPEVVRWTSSNINIAKVSEDGMVTAIKDGTVTITATANGSTATCKVTVKTEYTEEWSAWSDFDPEPITPSDTVKVETEERSIPQVVSYNINYYCTRRNDNKKRQFRNRSINLSDYPELDRGYGQNTTQTAFGVPYLVKTVDEMKAVEQVQPGEWSTGSQYGQNCADVVGYSFDGCIFYILSENTENVSVTYYRSCHLLKTPVEYQN